MRQVRFHEGETIFSEGDPSEHCYKIVSGSVAIRLRVAGVLRRGKLRTVATLGPGELLGEMGSIDKGKRSASAVAIKPSVCISYTRDEFLELLESEPQAALKFARMLVRRIRHADRVLTRPAAEKTAAQRSALLARRQMSHVKAEDNRI